MNGTWRTSLFPSRTDISHRRTGSMYDHESGGQTYGSCGWILIFTTAHHRIVVRDARDHGAFPSCGGSERRRVQERAAWASCDMRSARLHVPAPPPRHDRRGYRGRHLRLRRRHPLAVRPLLARRARWTSPPRSAPSPSTSSCPRSSAPTPRSAAAESAPPPTLHREGARPDRLRRAGRQRRSTSSASRRWATTTATRTATTSASSPSPPMDQVTAGVAEEQQPRVRTAPACRTRSSSSARNSWPGTTSTGGTSAPARRRVPIGRDPVDGKEYCFTLNATADAITGDANLPDPDWNFDAFPAQGLVRAVVQMYFDREPTATESGCRSSFASTGCCRRQSRAKGADIGSVAWVQDEAYRGAGQ